MIHKLLVGIVLLLGIQLNDGQFLGGKSQILDPVSWEAQVVKTENGQYNLIFQASIEQDWHLYSQFSPIQGSKPLVIKFLETPADYQLLGGTIESETQSEYAEVFDVEEVFFSDIATLTQTVQPTTGTRYIKAEIAYQACKDVCIDQEFYFVFDLKEEKGIVFKNYNEFEALGAKKTSSVNASSLTKSNPVITETIEEKRSLWTLFILAFLSGFIALLTPCVFPMIPMTVAFFTKRSTDKAKGKRNAIIYGFFIILIYVLLGSVVTAIFGADVLNALSTNFWFNIIFFIILVVFAISFFGAFEIMLPNSWANAVDRKADRGGIIGIFFMALALAIVSFSCTGPIVGTLLVEAASKGGIAPIVGMLGFSLAIAIPFALFALFPGWMNSLPKSGGWLNTIKVVLGFIELALAFKFLSNADLVIQAHWLEREVFLAIWIAIFGTLALYLFGKIKLPHDSEMRHIAVGRLCFGLLVLSFTIYLIPGLWGAPLKLISGITPPMFYSESPMGVGYAGGGNSIDEELAEAAELGPHQIPIFTDYETGMAYAKEEQKPVLLDFTGYNCANCRKMEERVWGEPAVLQILKNEVVLISLYVDSGEKLPEAEQYVSETTGRKIRKVGAKWSDFQIKNYAINAQPYYVLLDHKGNTLNSPVGYTPDVDTYIAWLKTGIDNF